MTDADRAVVARLTWTAARRAEEAWTAYYDAVASGCPADALLEEWHRRQTLMVALLESSTEVGK
jgi:hypothetical protein